MKKGSTIFLRIIILLIGIAVSAFCIVALPVVIKSENSEFIPIFITIYLSAIAFFYALYQTWKLLGLIDTNKAFSDMSVNSIKNIKYGAALFGGLYGLCSPYIYYLAEIDDAPGMLAVTIILIGGAIVVSTFAAVLQKLIQRGLDLKSENDLTV